MNQLTTDQEPREAPIRRTWQSWFADVFTFDVRSMALFRISVGALLIWDLVFRAQWFRDMYTEDGFMTRALSRDVFRVTVGDEIASQVWSLYWISESTSFQVFLFVLAGVFAAMLMVGAWTRVATIASWLLLVSLHARNPLVLTSGDFLLKMSLFWSMFLPLGAVWSVDAWRIGKRAMRAKTTLVSFATAAFMLQLIFMYFFTGVAKMNEDWFSGNAMYYVLRLDIYATDFGKSLLAYPTLLSWTSWATLFVEVILIWTMLFSWKNGFFRWLNLLIYWAFHIGIIMCLQIGLFPIICMIVWLPLIPVSFWNWCLKSKPVDVSRPVTRLDQGWVTNIVCAFMITIVLLWNVFNIQTPTNIAIGNRIGWRYVILAGYTLRIDQHFQMFGHPPKNTPWFVYEGRLRDGSEVDLFKRGDIVHARPESVRRAIPSHHWRKLHRNLVSPAYSELRQSLADYFVKNWNRDHDDEHQVDRMRLICYLESIGPDYNETDRHSQIWGSYTDPDRTGTAIFNELDKLTEDPLFQF